jgi:dihydrofolate synthase/folylpolyglutamate synthase
MCNESNLPVNIQQWLTRIEALHVAEIALGLSRLSEVAERLGLDPNPPGRQIIMVAGTNGKGSTVRAIEAVCVAQDIPCAAYTSPHLVDFGERLRFQGISSEGQQWVPFFERVERARLGVGDQLEVPLTFFEFTTLAAFLMLMQSEARVWILEIGLGGRLDAVNWLNASVAIVTRIARDHEAWLGDNLADIASEKCGIFRQGCLALWADAAAPAEVDLAVRQAAQSCGVGRFLTADEFGFGTLVDEGERDLYSDEVRASDSRGISAAEHALVFYGVDAGGQRWRLETGDTINGTPIDQSGSVIGLSAFGRLHPAAWAAALQTLALIVPDWGQLRDSVWPHCWADTRLPGRFDVLPGGQQGPACWIVDVAHNEDAMTVLIEKLKAARANHHLTRVVCVFGVLSDKPWGRMLTALQPWVSRWLLVTPETPRSVDAASLAEALGRIRPGCVETDQQTEIILPGPAALWREQVLRHVSKADVVLVCGSFFTVGPFYTDDKQSY